MEILPLGISSEPQSAAPQNIRDAARQFEALLISQLLRAARENGGSGGWLGTGEDRSTESMAEFSEQHVAELLSRSGGLGLARLIESGLSRSSSSEPLPGN